MVLLVVLQSQQTDLATKTLGASLKNGIIKLMHVSYHQSGNFTRQTNASSNSSFVTYRCF